MILGRRRRQDRISLWIIALFCIFAGVRAFGQSRNNQNTQVALNSQAIENLQSKVRSLEDAMIETRLQKMEMAMAEQIKSGDRLMSLGQTILGGVVITLLVQFLQIKRAPRTREE